MWKLLIVSFLFCHAPHLRGVEAAANTTGFYRATNTSRRFAVINNTNTIGDAILTTAQFVARDLVSKATIAEIELPSSVSRYERHLEASSIIFGLAKVANESQLNEQCFRALKCVEQGVLRRDPWAMKVLDASGSKPAGFIFGQNFWLGSREACGAVQRPIGITLSKNYQRIMNRGLIEDLAPFDVDYRVLYLRHHSPWQVEIKLMSEHIIHIGLCLPASCSSPEVQHLAREYVEQRRFVDADLYDVRPEVLYMKDLKLDESFYQKKSFKMFGAFLIFTSVMITLASVLNVKPVAETEIEKQLSEQTEATHSKSSSDSDETSPAKTKSAKHVASAWAKVRDFVKCFDVSQNCEKMFATKENRANEIPVINGLRSVSAIWILLFHVVWYMYFTVDNKPFLISYAERFFFQYVSSAPLLVDVFFTISGFLQAYNFMRNSRQMEAIRTNSFGQNVKQFFKMLFHRYLRLAPLYFVILGVVDLLSAYIQDVSVFHIHDRFDQSCSQHWWRNVFFIQNFFSHEDMCVNWTWSLACEMQYFILATALLFVYVKHPKFVKSVVIAALSATIGWSFFSGLSVKFQLSFDAAFASGTAIYISPFVRIMPYIMGTIAAWYFIEKRGEFDLSQLKEKCVWNLALLIFFSCIYSTLKRDISYFSSISLFVVGRFLFSLAVCWMIVGSASGRGSWWSRILEAKLFQHVNRLSYAIYLLNPFVIVLIFSMAQTSTHIDPFMMCVVSSGFAVIVYLASIVFSLAFEMPYSNWSCLILRRNKPKVA